MTPGALGMTLEGAAALAGLFLFQHADLQRNDVLHDPLAVGSTGDQVVHERADDCEMRFQIGPVDGNDMILPLVIDPGGGEAGISAELLEGLAPDGVVPQRFVQQVRPVFDVALPLLNVRFVEAIPHSIQPCISVKSVRADTQTHVPGQARRAEFGAQCPIFLGWRWQRPCAGAVDPYRTQWRTPTRAIP